MRTKANMGSALAQHLARYEAHWFGHCHNAVAAGQARIEQSFEPFGFFDTRF